MLSISTSPWAHYAGDLAAWTAALIATQYQHRRWPNQTRSLSRNTDASYFLMLGIGALIGAWFFGSLNSLRSVLVTPSHSIAGALAGGIIAVELWKWKRSIRRSTGGAFVLPICFGIVVGRIGCFLSGLPDYTFGTPSDLPWAVDLGDGVGRHPVQIYEAAAMAIFAAIYLVARGRGRSWAEHHAFHAMIIFYASQRFVLEFLKPYPTLVGPLNLFHFLMLGLVVYGVIWWRRGDDDPAGA